MADKEKILGIVRQNGPIIPVRVSKEINTSILMASALLSELVRDKLIKVSHIKVGSSPLYYVAGQEHKLQHYVDRLNSKEREVYNLLRQRTALKDSELEPVQRAAVRQIKDFAKAVEVTLGGKRELFWKWYLAPKDVVERLIKEELIAKPVEKESPREEIKREVEAPPSKPEVTKIKEPEKPKVKVPVAPKVKKFVDRTVQDEFLSKITWYFRKRNIAVTDKNVVRRNSEIDFTIEIPSPVGALTYYCKAKSKARVNDRDLSSAYVQGQLKKLPVIFLYTGELTKKAKEMLNKEFENMTVKKI